MARYWQPKYDVSCSKCNWTGKRTRRMFSKRCPNCGGYPVMPDDRHGLYKERLTVAKQKPKYVKSKDGKDRRTVRVEIRITPEEESMADLLYIDFKESCGDESLTFQQYLAILLRSALDEQMREIDFTGEA